MCLTQLQRIKAGKVVPPVAVPADGSVLFDVYEEKVLLSNGVLGTGEYFGKFDEKQLPLYFMIDGVIHRAITVCV